MEIAIQGAMVARRVGESSRRKFGCVQGRVRPGLVSQQRSSSFLSPMGLRCSRQSIVSVRALSIVVRRIVLLYGRGGEVNRMGSFRTGNQAANLNRVTCNNTSQLGPCNQTRFRIHTSVGAANCGSLVFPSSFPPQTTAAEINLGGRRSRKPEADANKSHLRPGISSCAEPVTGVQSSHGLQAEGFHDGLGGC